MNDTANQTSKPGCFRALLRPYRSLSPRGFLILMGLIAVVSFGIGIVFLWLGAWPVFGFFGLDVALIYLAFRLNYRDGWAYETIDLSPRILVLTRVNPSGAQEQFEFNPYWARVHLSEAHDGRTELMLASHGVETVFGKFLNDDERREFADMLRQALLDARTVRLQN